VHLRNIKGYSCKIWQYCAILSYSSTPWVNIAYFSLNFHYRPAKTKSEIIIRDIKIFLSAEALISLFMPGSCRFFRRTQDFFQTSEGKDPASDGKKDKPGEEPRQDDNQHDPGYRYCKLCYYCSL